MSIIIETVRYRDPYKGYWVRHAHDHNSDRICLFAPIFEFSLDFPRQSTSSYLLLAIRRMTGYGMSAVGS